MNRVIMPREITFSLLVYVYVNNPLSLASCNVNYQLAFMNCTAYIMTNSTLGESYYTSFIYITGVPNAM